MSNARSASNHRVCLKSRLVTITSSNHVGVTKIYVCVLYDVWVFYQNKNNFISYNICFSKLQYLKENEIKKWKVWTFTAQLYGVFYICTFTVYIATYNVTVVLSWIWSHALSLGLLARYLLACFNSPVLKVTTITGNDKEWRRMENQPINQKAN
jgi:hypothetical protein